MFEKILLLSIRGKKCKHDNKVGKQRDFFYQGEANCDIKTLLPLLHGQKLEPRPVTFAGSA